MRASPALLSLAPLILAACSDDSLKVRNTPPNVAFMAPADGSTVAPDTELALIAEVGDAESPLEELTLSWQRSDGVTLLGEQRSTDTSVSLTLTAGLPEGTYTVTLIVADPQAESDEDTVTFDVRPLPPDTGDTGGGDTADTGDTGDTGADTADTGGDDTADTGDTGAPPFEVDTTGCDDAVGDPALWTIVPEGPVFEDLTLDLVRSPYCVTGTVSMASGTTLTIEPGVRVLGADWDDVIIRWDGTDGALVAPSAPGLTTELYRLRFGTDSHMDDIPATARLSDVQTSSVRLFAMDAAVDGIDAVHVATFYSPATALTGVPSLSVTDGRFTQGGLYGDDVTVTDSVLDFVTVIGEHTITLERTRGSDLRVWMRNDRSNPGHLVTMREVTMDGGEVRSPFDPASSWNLPIAWDVRGSVFVGVVWGWLSDASSTGDADPHEIATASTFSGNVFAHHRGWFRITGADAVFTNNAFTDPTFSAAMTPHNRATLTLATDASATIRHNSFLGYDPALGHRTLGLDTSDGLAAEREPYGAGLDATENFLDTTDATTVQGLLHDRTDDPATFGNYIRVTPLLTSPHADTPDPAPWR